MRFSAAASCSSKSLNKHVHDLVNALTQKRKPAHSAAVSTWLSGVQASMAEQPGFACPRLLLHGGEAQPRLKDVLHELEHVIQDRAPLAVVALWPGVGSPDVPLAHQVRAVAAKRLPRESWVARTPCN